MTNPSAHRLNGRRILITGAASGIGRATAELFRAEGASLILVDRNAAGLQGDANLAVDVTEDQIPEPPDEAITKPADLINLGAGSRDTGIIDFAGTGGSVSLRNVAGTGRVAAGPHLVRCGRDEPRRLRRR